MAHVHFIHTLTIGKQYYCGSCTLSLVLATCSSDHQLWPNRKHQHPQPWPLDPRSHTTLPTLVLQTRYFRRKFLATSIWQLWQTSTGSFARASCKTTSSSPHGSSKITCTTIVESIQQRSFGLPKDLANWIGLFVGYDLSPTKPKTSGRFLIGTSSKCHQLLFVTTPAVRPLQASCTRPMGRSRLREWLSSRTLLPHLMSRTPPMVSVSTFHPVFSS